MTMASLMSTDDGVATAPSKGELTAGSEPGSDTNETRNMEVKEKAVGAPEGGVTSANGADAISADGVQRNIDGAIASHNPSDHAPKTAPTLDPNGATEPVTHDLTDEGADSKPAAAPAVMEAGFHNTSAKPAPTTVGAAASASATQEDYFDSDASRYSLKDLRQFQQQQCSVFSQLDFSLVRIDTLLKLFPKTYEDQLFPPGSFRVSAALVKQWLGMTREEQGRYQEKQKKTEARKRRAEKRTGKLPLGVVPTGPGFYENGRPPVVAPLVGKPPAPPLSQPIPFLEGKLSYVRLYYPRVPEGFTEWTNSSAMDEAFPKARGFPCRIVPVCLLLDAQTDQDKLIVVNWWRFLTKEEQKEQAEGLKRTYATPTVSNRKLPQDFWDKIKEYEERRLQRLKGPKVSIDPTGNDFYMKDRPKRVTKAKEEKVKDTSCRGWRGEKFENLFRASYKDVLDTLTMEGSAKVLDTIPVSEKATRSKFAKDLVFRREGANYVLRAVGCTGTREESIHRRLHCVPCRDLSTHAYGLKNAVANEKDAGVKQKERVASLQVELRSARRREKRLRAKIAKMKKGAQSSGHAVHVDDDDDDDDDDEDDEPTPKKRRAGDASRVMGSHSTPRRLPMAFVHNNHGYEQHSRMHGYHY